jgi:hypothetical protein
MNVGDVAIVVDAILESRPVQIAKATAYMGAVVGFLGLMIAACAVDIAFGRGDEWPS